MGAAAPSSFLPHFCALIMAGGRGTRFWPRSRKARTKQVLPVLGERTLIQQTFERLRPLVSPDCFLIITNEYLRDEIVRQLPEVPPEQIIAEPAQRNTAPCIGLAARILLQRDPEAVMGVFPSDHVISRPAEFRPFVIGVLWPSKAFPSILAAQAETTPPHLDELLRDIFPPSRARSVPQGPASPPTDRGNGRKSAGGRD